MIVKINKQKLVMEEVEQFDDISIEDLAEGVYTYIASLFGHRARSLVSFPPVAVMGYVCACRAPREFA